MKIHICHADHEHDRTYTENLVEYLERRGVYSNVVQLNASRYRPELEQCLGDKSTAVLSYNSYLDQSFISCGSFLAAAEAQKVPVIQWILDHPSTRWREFHFSTIKNSRFLLNTRFSEQYFRRRCVPGARTSVMGGVGPNPRSHARGFSEGSFSARPISCMIPLSLKRAAGTIEETRAAIAALGGWLAASINDAALTAQFDLTKPLEVHLSRVLGRSASVMNNQIFNDMFMLFEESVQTLRRLKIFEIASQYPLLIQSDASAAPYLPATKATLAVDIGMRDTLLRMRQCRSVLSVSPLNDMIHDRAMNAVNAGCVPIVEDNLAHRGILRHKENALLFRYDDDSLQECFDIICNQPQRAFRIAEAAMKLRDEAYFGCEFQNLIALAQPQNGVTQSAKA